MISYKEKLPAITTLIFDIDGVLTNGEVFVLKNEFARAINTKDAYAIQYARRMGYTVLIITGGESQELKKSLEDIGVHEVYLRSSNKVEVYNQAKAKYQFEDYQALYMGDDIPDYKVMEIVGVATCPQDAVTEIKHIAHYQSPILGGKGCVRDVIEQTLRSQGKWFKEEAFHW
jgi:3-deoxy-D-manno-octulosonate 8-phosphate phosphatase (KDO 8-P phosphatase)